MKITILVQKSNENEISPQCKNAKSGVAFFLDQLVILIYFFNIKSDNILLIRRTKTSTKSL